MNHQSKSSAIAIPKIERGIALQLLWIGSFAVATAVSARIEIPHEPVPYTLQTLVVLLAGAFLGARNAALSQLLYLAMGAAGLPVFAAGSVGVLTLIGPTAGYLLAFPLSAFIIGYLLDKRTTLAWSFGAMAVGLVLIFCSGTLFLHAFYVKEFSAALAAGFLPFSWWDLIKLSAAATSYHEIAKRWPRIPGI